MYFSLNMLTSAFNNSVGLLRPCPLDTSRSIFANFNFYFDCTSILPHSTLFPNDRNACDSVVVCTCGCVYVPVCAFVLRIAKVLWRS